MVTLVWRSIMLKINSVSFRGGGGESCGSIGNLDGATLVSKFSSTSFKANNESLTMRKQPEKDTFEKSQSV